MANLDDSIENLRTLIARLQDSREKTQEARGTVNDLAGELATLEGNATQAIGELIASLDSFQGALRDGEGEASGQIDRVADEAHRTTAERLAELSHKFDENDVVNTVNVFREDLDKDHAALVANGFQVMTTAVGHVQGELEAARQDAEAAFQAFDGSVQGLHDESEASFAASADAMEASLTDLGDEGTKLQDHASQCESELHGRANDLQAACTDTGDAATAAYDGHVATIDAAAQDLTLSVHTLIEDTAGYLTTLSADHVDAPVGLVIDDAIPPLMDELEHLDELARDAGHTTSDTEALCSELERCQQVVTQIDQILDALQEG